MVPLPLAQPGALDHLHRQALTYTMGSVCGVRGQRRRGSNGLDYFSLHPTPPSFWSSLEGTNWLHYVSQLLAVAVEVGEVLVGGAPALVHCSDGWDRTPQVVSLTKIIMDPYYRTMEVRVGCDG